MTNKKRMPTKNNTRRKRKPLFGDELIAQALLLERFGEAWHSSAAEGENLDLMQRAHAGSRGLTFPFWQHLQEMTAIARISLDAGLAALRIHADPIVSGATAFSIATAAALLGMTKGECDYAFRLSLAERMGHPLLPDLMMANRAGTSSSQAFASQALTRCEASYPPDIKSELAEITAAVERVFAPPVGKAR